MFAKLGYTTMVEPRYKTSAGLRKPDLLIFAPGKPSVIIDVTCVSDMYVDLNIPHFSKVDYYSQRPEIVHEVTALTGQPPSFSSISISWRGCFSPQSASDLRELGLTASNLGLLSAITVEQGAIIHRIFNTTTRSWT